MKMRTWAIVAVAVLFVGGCSQAPATSPAAPATSTHPPATSSGVPTKSSGATGTSGPGSYPPITTEGDGYAPTPPVPAAAKANHDRALAATLQLIRLAAMPSSARQLESRPAEVPAPGMGIALTTSRIDSTTYFEVPMSMRSSDAWIKTHPPKGLVQAGSNRSGGSTGSTASLGEQYDGRPGSALEDGSLQYTVAPATDNTTVWRIDGIAFWLDPDPMKDSAVGTRIHVAVGDGCPASDKGVVGVRNSSAELSARLAPAPRPTAALVCGYEGMNGATYDLKSQRRLTGSAAARLGAQASALPLSWDPGEGPHSCPMDDLSMALIVFGYADGSSVDLWQKLNGCTTVANGSIVALWGIDLH